MSALRAKAAFRNWAKTERPPRGGLSEIPISVLITRLVSASCATQEDPTRRGQWRRAGAQQATGLSGVPPRGWLNDNV